MSTIAGPIMLAQEYLRTTLADSAAFRTFVGASGSEAQTQALNRIHHEGLPLEKVGETFTASELRALRPCAIVWIDDGGAGYSTTALAAGVWSDRGSLHVELQWDVPDEIRGDMDEADRRFKSLVGQIIADIKVLAYAGGYLACEEISLVEGPVHIHPDDESSQGDYVWVRLHVTWRSGE